MGRLNKMMIQRAEGAIDRKQLEHLAEWQRHHPEPPNRNGLPFRALMAIATGDPEFAPALLRKANRGDSYRGSDQVTLCSLDLVKMSPNAKEANDRALLPFQKWEKRDNGFRKQQHRQKQALLDRAIIGGMSPDDLLIAVSNLKTVVE